MLGRNGLWRGRRGCLWRGNVLAGEIGGWEGQDDELLGD